MRLHVEKSGTLTYCGRRVRQSDRIDVRAPSRYWLTCEAMKRLGCYSCSDRLFAALKIGNSEC